MDFDKVIKERHSTRHFLPKDVSFHKVISIIEAGTYAPAAGNIFTTRVIIVTNPEIKLKLVDAAAGQQFLSQVPYVFVVCSDPSQAARSYGKRADLYMSQQAGAAIENMLLKATELGVDTCWVGAFDETTVKRLLHIPDHVKVEALMPIGYSEEKKIKKHIERRKMDIKHVASFNGFGIFRKRLVPGESFEV